MGLQFIRHGRSDRRDRRARKPFAQAVFASSRTRRLDQATNLSQIGQRDGVDAKRNEKSRDGDPGVLAASGMIAGEGLAGVLIALLIAASGKFAGLRDSLAHVHLAAKEFTYVRGATAIVIGIAVVLTVCGLLYRSAKSAA